MPTNPGRMPPSEVRRHESHDKLSTLQAALAGEFTVERLIGRGGMGLVYLAREVRLDRAVAIKLLPPEMARDEAVRDRFLREARTAAMLSHPNIVPIYRVEERAGLVFIVMAYVDGPTLGARVRRDGPRPPHEVAMIIRDVAWALAYAHARGVVHCDIKPDNILLERETGRALVTDFGIAQVGDAARLGAAGPVVGSAHFMSPEQASGRRIDARSDIYSLGVVAWFALTGQVPFDGPVSVVLRKQVSTPVPSLATVRPDVPASLATTLEHALAKSPDDRYQSAESFAEGIALSIAPQVVHAMGLEVWLSGGDELRYVFAAVLGFSGLAVSHRGPWTEMAAYVGAALVGLVMLELWDVRRLMATGYQLSHLRAALRAHVADRDAVAHRGAAFAAARFHGGRQTFLRRLGYAIVGVAAALLVLIVLRDQRFSSHALGVGILGAGVLALGSRTLRRDRVLAARQAVWCSPVGGWLAALASFHVSAMQSPAVDAALLLPTSAGVPPRLAASDGAGDLQRAVQRLAMRANALRDRIDTLGPNAPPAPPNDPSLEAIRLELRRVEEDAAELRRLLELGRDSEPTRRARSG